MSLTGTGSACCLPTRRQLDDDPQARLLVQVQGVIAEYELLRALALADAELGGPSALRFADKGSSG